MNGVLCSAVISANLSTTKNVGLQCHDARNGLDDRKVLRLDIAKLFSGILALPVLLRL